MFFSTNIDTRNGETKLLLRIKIKILVLFLPIDCVQADRVRFNNFNKTTIKEEEEETKLQQDNNMITTENNRKSKKTKIEREGKKNSSVYLLDFDL